MSSTSTLLRIALAVVAAVALAGGPSTAPQARSVDAAPTCPAGSSC
jgi:hypothetical protein